MQTQTAPQAAPRHPASAVPFAPRAAAYLAAPRPRAFGVGYGRSSGYATARHYAQDAGAARFRFA